MPSCVDLSIPRSQMEISGTANVSLLLEETGCAAGDVATMVIGWDLEVMESPTVTVQ